MNSIPYIDILILAMIAIFIINRLKNVLGKKTGNEQDIVEKFTQKRSSFKESEPDKTSQTIDTKNKDENSQRKFHKNPKINDSLKNIHALDLNFSIDDFITGAKKAFEFIISNYSQENIKSLKKLLSDEIYDDFDSQIKERNKNKENLDITIISIKDTKIINSKVVKKNTAFITVNFLSEQVQITKNPKGDIIEGDSNQILDISENWTFKRNLKNKDPNWILDTIEESE
ncbi:MAG: hypothetical protein CMM95_02645 [Rickettsiales bacterium]|nr:hypothetical protein [Rickettsiales bacterium]